MQTYNLLRTALRLRASRACSLRFNLLALQAQRQFSNDSKKRFTPFGQHQEETPPPEESDHFKDQPSAIKRLKEFFSGGSGEATDNSSA